MLDGVPQKLDAEPVSLPFVGYPHRNLAGQGIINGPDVPHHGDRFRLVRRQRHVRDVSVPVGPRHLASSVSLGFAIGAEKRR
jgi:hypothetical protein